MRADSPIAALAVFIGVSCGGRVVGADGTGSDSGSESDTTATPATTAVSDSGTDDSTTDTGGSETSDSGGDDSTDSGQPPPDSPQPQPCPGLFGGDEDPMTPKAIAHEQPGVFELDHDEDYVVWVSATTREVVRLSKCDGSLLVLHDDIHFGHDVAIGADRVFMTERYSGGRIVSVPLDGGEKFVVEKMWAPSQPDDMDADDEFVFWVQNGLGSSVRRAPHGGNGSEAIASFTTATGYVTLTEDRAYLADGSELKWVAKTGGPVTTLGKLDAQIVRRAHIDETHVYSSSWLYGDDGVIFRVPIAGGNPEVLVDGQGVPTHLALDEDHVYWVNQGYGTVVRMPKDGGPVEELAAGQDIPEDVAVDERYVFWAALGDERVMVRELP